MAQNAYDPGFFDDFARWDPADQQNLVENISPGNRRQFLDDFRRWGETQRSTTQEAPAPTTPTTPTKPSGSGGLLEAGIGALASQSMAPTAATASAPKIVAATQGGSALAPNALNVTDAGFFDQGGSLQGVLGQTGAGVLGAAGLGLGAKGAYDAYKSGDPLSGAISGAGAGAGGLALAGALGASTGGLALPVIAGLGALGGLGGAFGGRKSGKDILAGRISSLQEKGVYVPDAEKRVSDYGASKDELIAREQQQYADRGEEWDASKSFAATRDESLLRPEDTWGGLMWFETLGNDYLDSTAENQRREMNQRALDEGLIDEARGQLQTNNPERLAEIYNEVLEDTPPIDPNAIKDGEPDQFRAQGARQPTGQKKRPKPMNKIPEFEEEEPPLIQTPPIQPELKSPADYAAAYANVYNMNQGQPANPLLTGRY